MPLSSLVARVRAGAEAGEWRPAIDALRPVTQRLWASSDAGVRGRFLRHLRPYWDVHRHRIAPAVADRIEAMVAGGRLRFAAGKVVSAAPTERGVRLVWRPRGRGATEMLEASRVVNCTGPQGDLSRSTDPLLSTLHARGTIRADALRLGIDIDDTARVIGADGAAAAGLYCVGPMTRGALWEVVAVPDIRGQVAELARHLAGMAPPGTAAG